MVLLNLFIFNLLSYNLVIDVSYNRILELSLLSKSTFKIIQNIITSFKFNKNNKFILSINQLKRYSSKNKNNDEIYKLKLIQYKEIEMIRVEYELGNGSSNEILKKKLKSNCKNLKKVVLLNNVNCNSDIRFDFTCNGFFKVKCLSLKISTLKFPFSQNEALTNLNDIYNFKFSFSFLSKYKPKKLIIYTSFNKGYQYYDYHGGLDTSCFYINFENILNYKSIKSIQFKNVPTTREFIKLALNTNNETQTTLESLEICEIRRGDSSEAGKFIDYLEFSNFLNNSTLKKLVIRCLIDPDWDCRYYPTDNKLDELITLVSLNSNLKTFGLIGFGIDDCDIHLLNPLSNSNITKLITDSDHFNIFFDYCLENSKIQKLHYCINKYDSNDSVNLEIKNKIYSLLNNDNYSDHYDSDHDDSDYDEDEYNNEDQIITSLKYHSIKYSEKYDNIKF